MGNTILVFTIIELESVIGILMAESGAAEEELL